MNAGWGLLTPEFVLAGAAFLVWGADLVLPQRWKGWLPYLGILGLLAALATVAAQFGLNAQLAGLIQIDHFSALFRIGFPLLGIAVCVLSLDFVRQRLEHPGEYYGLVLVAVLAMMLMSSASELLTAYISLELMSFAFYVLTSYAREDPKSNEAGVKYILLGALSSAILLFGLSLLYGATGTTTFVGLADSLRQGTALVPVFGLGLVLVLGGFAFKVAAVPFHMWAPDVYEGAPTPITAFLSVASKAAAFALLLRLVATAFLPIGLDWQAMVAALALVSMLVGNLVALAQRNIKRLIAYSSIGQAGYLLLGFSALRPGAAAVSDAILFHLIGYAATNLAAFIGIIAVYNRTSKEEISDYDGLAQRAPLLALVLAVAFFSSAGLPFFAGFTTKFYLFAAAVRESPSLLWLAGVAIAMSLVSLYYYLVVIKHMYINAPPGPDRIEVSRALSGAALLLIAIIVALGVYPSPLIHLIARASRVLFA